MKELNSFQKKFLLDSFFKNEDYAGWKNIAVQLIENGECVVAGSDCIWIGGVGNFITTTKANKYVGCTLYELDLSKFMESKYYKEIRTNELTKLECAREKAISEYDDILNLV